MDADIGVITRSNGVAMKRKKTDMVRISEMFSIVIIAAILLSSSVFAINENGLSITINVPQSFTESQMLSFEYTLGANAQIDVTYIPYIICPDNGMAYLLEKQASLMPGQQVILTYQDSAIGPSTNPGECTAGVRITSPEKYSGIEETATFTIDTKPPIKTTIMTCADPQCTMPKKIFLRGERVYAKAINTDDKEKTLSISSQDAQFNEETGTAALSTETTGSKKIRITATHQDYKGQAATEASYIVIDKYPEIRKKEFPDRYQKNIGGYAYRTGSDDGRNPISDLINWIKGLFGRNH